jgi:hypothetical protein
VTTHLAAATDILRLRRATKCLGTSRGSLSTTSPTQRVRVPRLVVRPVARLVAPLLVEYFEYATRPGASARRAARRRLLRLRRVSGCLVSSRGSSRRSSSTTSPTPYVRVPRHVARLVVDFFAYVARPGASAHRTARRGLLRLAQARRRLLHLRCVSGCLGSSRGSSSTTSTTPRVQVPRHVARLVDNYFDYAARPGASARHVGRCAAHH